LLKQIGHSMAVLDKILDADFPIGIFASAGTGKTKTLTDKVLRLVRDRVNPVNILAFTFTVDSANELKSRIPSNEKMTIGTIHSVSLRIVRENGRKKYTVMDDYQQKTIIFELFKRLKVDFDRFIPYTSKMSFCKNLFVDYYSMLEDDDERLVEYFGEEKLLRFAKAYEAERERLFRIGFDDMTLKALEVLQNNPKILDAYQERWRYIFLDEAQDICPVQTEFIKLLGDKYRNLFVVGDKKQSIYQSFRASSPDYLMNFKSLYKNATMFELPTTYRCKKSICDAGNRIAGLIDGSVINTAVEGEGEIIDLGGYETQHTEAINVSKRAYDEFQKTDNSIRILYRTNAQSLSFQLYMLNNNIPYTVSLQGSVFNTKEFRFAMNLCEFILDYNEMTQSEKAVCIAGLVYFVKNKFDLYKLVSEMKKNDKINPLFQKQGERWSCGYIRSVKRRYEMIAKPQDIISQIIEESVLTELSDSVNDNLAGLAEFFSDCITTKEMRDIIAKLQEKRTTRPNERVIRLSTIHSAKGLEADTVFLTGLSEGTLPHRRGLSNEEMNLFYVGVTRAKSKLYLSNFDTFAKRRCYRSKYFSFIMEE